MKATATGVSAGASNRTRENNSKVEKSIQNQQQTEQVKPEEMVGK